MTKRTNPNLKDLKELALRQKKKGDLDSAVISLEQAIDVTWRELADLHGILGGTRKLQGDFVAAIAEYDAGFRLDSQYNALSSYNDLNRLVTRVLLCPGALSDPNLLRKEDGVEFVDLRLELSRLEKELQRDLAGVRSNDYWAAGDLAIAAALNGYLATATKAVKQFVSYSSLPDNAYGSYIQTLSQLEQLDLPDKEIILSVKALFERKSPTG